MADGLILRSARAGSPGGGSPGVGSWRALGGRGGRPPVRRRCRRGRARRGRRSATACARARAAAAASSTALAARDGGPGGRGRRRDLRGPGAVRARPGDRRPGAGRDRRRRVGRGGDRPRRRPSRPTASPRVDDEYFRERAADLRDVGRRVADLLTGRTRPELHRARRPPAVCSSPTTSIRRSWSRPPAGARRRHRPGRRRPDGPRGDRRPGARHPARPRARRTPSIRCSRTHDRPLDGRDRSTCSLTAVGRRLSLCRCPSRPGRQGRLPSPHGSHGIARDREACPSPLEAASCRGRVGDGIGLVRTELIFLDGCAPGESKNSGPAARILVCARCRSDAVRTLDIGGTNRRRRAAGQASEPGARRAEDAASAWSGPRSSMAQLRALWDSIRQASSSESCCRSSRRSREDRRRPCPGSIRSWHQPVRPALVPVLLGVIDRVPAAALVADRLPDVADFSASGPTISFQFTLAADRVDPSMADLADPLQPAVVALIVGRRGGRHGLVGRHVAVCGEAAEMPR